MGSSLLEVVSGRLRGLADLERARQSAVFLQTQPGGYGEGDRLLGIAVPQVRAVVKEFREADPHDALPLVRSAWHEERLCGYLLWLEAWMRAASLRRADEGLQVELVELLWANTSGLDNWDLVDSIAPTLPGRWLLEHPDPARIDALVRSGRVWDRRLAVLAEFAAVRIGRHDGMLALCERLLGDRHDLMHKACGWMLREVGNRDLASLRHFLSQHSTVMPRTMLRYAIEKLDPDERDSWMGRSRSS